MDILTRTRIATTATRQGGSTLAAGGQGIVVVLLLQYLGLPTEVAAGLGAAWAAVAGVIGTWARDRQHAGDTRLLVRLATLIGCIALILAPAACVSITTQPDGSVTGRALAGGTAKRCIEDTERAQTTCVELQATFSPELAAVVAPVTEALGGVLQIVVNLIRIAPGV